MPNDTQRRRDRLLPKALRTRSRGAARYPIISLILFSIPSLLFIGNAVDFQNAHLARADLQHALDAATRNMLADIDSKTDDDLRSSLARMVEKQLSTEEGVQTLTVSVDRKKKKLTCKASVRVETTVASLIGAPFLDVTAEASAEITSTPPVELR